MTPDKYLDALRTHWKANKSFPSMAKLAEVMGLAERGRNNTPLVDVLEEELGAFLDKADTRIFASDEKMDDAIKRIVRQVTMEEIGKKPEVTVVISRLTDE